MFDDLNRVRLLAGARRNRFGEPADDHQIELLDSAIHDLLGLRLPTAYRQLLQRCNGYRVDDWHLFGVDAGLAGGAGDVTGLDGCLAFNADRKSANADAGIDEPFLYLAWFGDSTFCVKADGSCWEQDPETTEDVEHYRDCAAMLESVLRRTLAEA